MNIENINFQSVLKPFGINSQNNEKVIEVEPVKVEPFDSFFNAFINIIEETSAYQNQADKIQLDYAAGKTDDMLSVMLAQEKAYASLNFTLQVTNKVIEAYKEIMRISL